MPAQPWPAKMRSVPLQANEAPQKSLLFSER